MVSPTIITITADGAAHPLTTNTVLGASWVQFVAPTANSGVAYVGPSGVTSGTGTPLPATAGLFLPPLPADTRDNQLDRRYQLSNWYYICQTGDKLIVTYVP